MKIIHKITEQVIDVPSDHANMLFTQGWKEFAEVKNEIKTERKDSNDANVKNANEKEEVLIPEFSKGKQRGRPKANRI